MGAINWQADHVQLRAQASRAEAGRQGLKQAQASRGKADTCFYQPLGQQRTPKQPTESREKCPTWVRRNAEMDSSHLRSRPSDTPTCGAAAMGAVMTSVAC